MKNNLVKKIIRSLVVASLIVINVIYVVISSHAMNPIIHPLLFCAAIILIMLANVFTSIMYLLGKEIKIVRIVISSISLVAYLSILIFMVHSDYYAWTSAGLSLVLLMLDIFFKPLKCE